MFGSKRLTEEIDLRNSPTKGIREKGTRALNANHK
jgi:hypothetical protein